MNQEEFKGAMEEVLSTLSKAEEEELNRICRPLGQMAVLMGMLRTKGIFTSQEIHSWEEDSDKATAMMKDLLKARRDMEASEDIEEAYRCSKIILDKSIELSQLLGENDRKINELRASHEELRKMYEEEKASEADQED